MAQDFHTDRWVDTSLTQICPTASSQIVEAEILYTSKAASTVKRTAEIIDRFFMVHEHILWVPKID
jgi:hypothetical protein